MDRRIIGWSIAAGLLLSLLVLHGPPAEGAQEQRVAPRIEFDTPELDFGTIYQGENVTQKFLFRNAGNATLKIEKVRTTCGCAAALPAKSELAPGEEGEIEVTFRAGLMRGRIVKHVYIDTNDPLQSRVDLRVTVEVKVEVELVPHGIYIGRLAVGEAIQRSIDLYSPEVPAFSILKVSADHPALQVGEPVTVGGQPNRYRLHVQFGPAEKAGRVNAKIALQTDLPHCKQLVVRVYGNVMERGSLSEPAEPRSPGARGQ